jgi:hypothetical protein
MCLKQAFAYQQAIAGIEYKINQLRGDHKFVKTKKTAFTALFLGPGS